MLTPTKHGEFLITNLTSGRRGGFFARIAAATMLPAAISWTCPDRNAWIVALLSSKRLIVAFGASCDSAISSSAPRVAPTVLPVRSAGVLTFTSDGPNTPWKYGAYALEKSMTFSRSGVLPSEEITMSTLLVVRYGIRFALFTGTSFSLTPSALARSPAMSMS